MTRSISTFQSNVPNVHAPHLMSTHPHTLTSSKPIWNRMIHISLFDKVTISEENWEKFRGEENFELLHWIKFFLRVKNCQRLSVVSKKYEDRIPEGSAYIVFKQCAIEPETHWKVQIRPSVNYAKDQLFHFVVKFGLKKVFTLDLIIWAQSTANLLFIGSFSAWWQPTKQTSGWS